MSELADFERWLATPAGRYLLAWEQDRLDQSVADLFGFHALQLGLPGLDALRANRMPHRWFANGWIAPEPLVGPGAAVSPMFAGSQADRDAGRLAERHAERDAHRAVVPDAGGDAGAAAAGVAAGPQPRALALHCDFDALPFPAHSIDLVVLPHTLELARDPHLTLREVERVLVPEGRVAILGFNPASLWGVRQRMGRMRRRLGGQGPLFLPPATDLIGYWRLRDWLRLLSFEVEGGRFGCYRPALASERWLERFAWMDETGDRWWPVLGAVYFLLAVKRVRGMRLVGLARRERSTRKAAPAVAVNRLPARVPAHGAAPLERSPTTTEREHTANE